MFPIRFGGVHFRTKTYWSSSFQCRKAVATPTSTEAGIVYLQNQKTLHVFTNVFFDLFEKLLGWGETPEKYIWITATNKLAVWIVVSHISAFSFPKYWYAGLNFFFLYFLKIEFFETNIWKKKIFNTFFENE